MATLPEDDTFPEGVYRIETTDPVVGGPPNEATGAGLTNIPAMHLAKRTRWLKNRVDTLLTTVVAATTAVAGIVRLNSSTASTSVTEAATPSAVKAAMDNANTRVPVTRMVTGGGLAAGGGALTDDRTIYVPIATVAEAEAGDTNVSAMTPMRVFQAIAKRIETGVVQAGSAFLSALTALGPTGIVVRSGASAAVTRSIAAGTGITVANGNGVAADPTISLMIATQAEAEAGTINTAAVTPLRVAQAIAAMIAAGGVQAGAAILGAISGLAANGLVARTAAGTVAARTVTGSTAITVTNGDGVAGNPTIALTIATQAEAEAATIATKGMTPQRTGNAVQALTGNSKAWVAVTRDVDTTYQNTGAFPIDVLAVFVSGSTISGYIDIGASVGALTERCVFSSTGGWATTVTLRIPPGHYYRWRRQSTAMTVSTWAERTA